MRFCANISFMFKELPFQERYFAAKELGFRGVESAFPNIPEKDFDNLVRAKENSGVEQVLINIYCGDQTKGNSFKILVQWHHHKNSPHLQMNFHIWSVILCFGIAS